jgi:hypothetical protein
MKNRYTRALSATSKTVTVVLAGLLMYSLAKDMVREILPRIESRNTKLERVLNEIAPISQDNYQPTKNLYSPIK